MPFSVSWWQRFYSSYCCHFHIITNTDTNRRDNSTLRKQTTALCVATHFPSLIRLLTLHKLNMKFMLNLAWLYLKLPFQEVLLHPLLSTSLWKCLKCVWCIVTTISFYDLSTITLWLIFSHAFRQTLKCVNSFIT